MFMDEAIAIRSKIQHRVWIQHNFVKFKSEKSTFLSHVLVSVDLSCYVSSSHLVLFCEAKQRRNSIKRNLYFRKILFSHPNLTQYFNTIFLFKKEILCSSMGFQHVFNNEANIIKPSGMKCLLREIKVQNRKLNTLIKIYFT